MLVLCDFDGTITQFDVTNYLLDKFTGLGWRETILKPYWAGQITHLEVMQLCYRDLSTPQAELLEYSKGVPLRAGFERFVEFCREQSYFFSVVSGGLDFYIKAFLTPDVPFYSYLGRYDEAARHWQVSLPDWPSMNIAAKEDFKVRVLEELRQQHPADLPAVFIGDGRNDGPVAAHAEIVFAVKGSRLAQICAERGQPCTEFEDFGEIMAELRERN